MKLSISNIAWPPEEEDFYLRLIKGLGCSGVEIAPGKVWQMPLESSREERASYASFVRGHGLEMSAMQALLYGHPELGLFGEADRVNKTIEYLKGICSLASDLGIRVLVFGSPANRRRGPILMDEAFERAAAFFSKIAPFAEENGTCICIEPLRPQETDFITTSEGGLKLVEMVDNPGFGLHLDAKALVLEKGNHSENIRKALHRMKYFHINDPELKEVNSSGEVDHFRLGTDLKAAGYDGYVSIEMRTMPDYQNCVRRSLDAAKRAYINI